MESKKKRLESDRKTNKQISKYELHFCDKVIRESLFKLGCLLIRRLQILTATAHRAHKQNVQNGMKKKKNMKKKLF